MNQMTNYNQSNHLEPRSNPLGPGTKIQRILDEETMPVKGKKRSLTSKVGKTLGSVALVGLTAALCYQMFKPNDDAIKLGTGEVAYVQVIYPIPPETTNSLTPGHFWDGEKKGAGMNIDQYLALFKKMNEGNPCVRTNQNGEIVLIPKYMGPNYEHLIINAHDANRDGYSRVPGSIDQPDNAKIFMLKDSRQFNENKTGNGYSLNWLFVKGK